MIIMAEMRATLEAWSSSFASLLPDLKALPGAALDSLAAEHAFRGANVSSMDAFFTWAVQQGVFTDGSPQERILKLINILNASLPRREEVISLNERFLEAFPALWPRVKLDKLDPAARARILNAAVSPTDHARVWAGTAALTHSQQQVKEPEPSELRKPDLGLLQEQTSQRFKSPPRTTWTSPDTSAQVLPAVREQSLVENATMDRNKPLNHLAIEWSEEFAHLSRRLERDLPEAAVTHLCVAFSCGAVNSVIAFFERTREYFTGKTSWKYVRDLSRVLSALYPSNSAVLALASASKLYFPSWDEAIQELEEFFRSPNAVSEFSQAWERENDNRKQPKLLDNKVLQTSKGGEALTPIVAFFTRKRRLRWFMLDFMIRHGFGRKIIPKGHLECLRAEAESYSAVLPTVVEAVTIASRVEPEGPRVPTAPQPSDPDDFFAKSPSGISTSPIATPKATRRLLITHLFSAEATVWFDVIRNDLPARLARIGSSPDWPTHWYGPLWGTPPLSASVDSKDICAWWDNKLSKVKFVHSTQVSQMDRVSLGAAEFNAMLDHVPLATAYRLPFSKRLLQYLRDKAKDDTLPTSNPDRTNSPSPLAPTAPLSYNLPIERDVVYPLKRLVKAFKITDPESEAVHALCFFLGAEKEDFTPKIFFNARRQQLDYQQAITNERLRGLLDGARTTKGSQPTPTSVSLLRKMGNAFNTSEISDRRRYVLQRTIVAQAPEIMCKLAAHFLVHDYPPEIPVPLKDVVRPWMLLALRDKEKILEFGRKILSQKKGPSPAPVRRDPVTGKEGDAAEAHKLMEKSAHDDNERLAGFEQKVRNLRLFAALDPCAALLPVLGKSGRSWHDEAQRLLHSESQWAMRHCLNSAAYQESTALLEQFNSLGLSRWVHAFDFSFDHLGFPYSPLTMANFLAAAKQLAGGVRIRCSAELSSNIKDIPSRNDILCTHLLIVATAIRRIRDAEVSLSLELPALFPQWLADLSRNCSFSPETKLENALTLKGAFMAARDDGRSPLLPLEYPFILFPKLLMQRGFVVACLCAFSLAPNGDPWSELAVLFHHFLRDNTRTMDELKPLLACLDSPGWRNGEAVFSTLKAATSSATAFIRSLIFSGGGDTLNISESLFRGVTAAIDFFYYYLFLQMWRANCTKPTQPSPLPRGWAELGGKLWRWLQNAPLMSEQQLSALKHMELNLRFVPEYDAAHSPPIEPTESPPLSIAQLKEKVDKAYGLTSTNGAVGLFDALKGHLPVFIKDIGIGSNKLRVFEARKHDTDAQESSHYSFLVTNEGDHGLRHNSHAQAETTYADASDARYGWVAFAACDKVPHDWYQQAMALAGLIREVSGREIRLAGVGDVGAAVAVIAGYMLAKRGYSFVLVYVYGGFEFGGPSFHEKLEEQCLVNLELKRWVSEDDPDRLTDFRVFTPKLSSRKVIRVALRKPPLVCPWELFPTYHYFCLAVHHISLHLETRPKRRALDLVVHAATDLEAAERKSFTLYKCEIDFSAHKLNSGLFIVWCWQPSSRRSWEMLFESAPLKQTVVYILDIFLAIKAIGDRCLLAWFSPNGTSSVDSESGTSAAEIVAKTHSEWQNEFLTSRLELHKLYAAGQREKLARYRIVLSKFRASSLLKVPDEKHCQSLVNAYYSRFTVAYPNCTTLSLPKSNNNWRAWNIHFFAHAMLALDLRNPFLTVSCNQMLTLDEDPFMDFLDSAVSSEPQAMRLEVTKPAKEIREQLIENYIRWAHEDPAANAHPVVLLDYWNSICLLGKNLPKNGKHRAKYWRVKLQWLWQLADQCRLGVSLSPNNPLRRVLGAFE